MLGKSPIKWRQRPDMTMTIAVDWDIKHHFKQINSSIKAVGLVLSEKKVLLFFPIKM